IHANVSVTNQLARLSPGNSQAHSQHDAVETPLKLLQQHFAGHALGTRSLLEVVAELAFLREVNALGFLLLVQLQAVSDDLGLAVFTVLARREVALLNRTLIAE